ncbi:uncharacterized protein LOC115984735 [Quercus lobata]|uniref:uncharacterized protein LOC115984735 n=1 Tax=Quercus lobata TaxID=97700 RepID=UPI0012468AAA|nr:uncharacterized protein LOC115984735 [Quercus lobata]
MLVNCTRRMWFMLCSVAQPCNPFGGNKEPDLFVAVLWTLWNRRNNLRLGKPTLSLGQVVDFAQDRILERASCNAAFQQPQPHQQIPLPGSVIEVEVLAARKALELTIELGFDNITLEGDSEVLINSLAKGGNSLAHYGHLLADTHVLMIRFSSLSLSHVKRNCNSLAHALARRASSTPDLSIWMEEIPPDLNSVYMADLSGLVNNIYCLDSQKKKHNVTQSFSFLIEILNYI